jgi:hypothetical protein
MKQKLPLAFAILASMALLVSAVSVAPAPDPIGAFGSLETGDALVVKRDLTRLDVGAPGSVEAIFSLSDDGIATLQTGLTRPPAGSQASVREVLGANGEVDWHVAHTSRGARLLVSRDGVLHPRGVQVLLLDNDDLHVAAGDGSLLYARRTLTDGTLLEHEGVDGCDCARSTSPQGVVTVEAR